MRTEADVFFEKVSELPEKFPSRIVRFFPETNMKGGFDSLAKIAKEHRINVRNLKWGEYLIFVNKKRDKLKMISGLDLVAYLRMPEGAKIDLRTVALLPRFFNGSEIEYNKALEEVLTKTLGHRGVQSQRPTTQPQG